ncbi:MAG: hypothetical protein IT379_24175 [Deltaproteobacteria bacterium]|nr:hypothetical protein [Deltaproteobacteria bacterium]
MGSLRRVFAPRAIYKIVGSRVLRGITGIEAYWRTNAAVQRDVRWRAFSLHRTPAFEALEFRAWFFRIDLNRSLVLDGLMTLEVDQGRITRLVECYRRREG